MEINDIARALNLAAAQMRERPSSQEALDHLVRNATEALPNFEHVGLSTFKDGKATNLATTSPLVAELDDLQYGLAEGPCVDTIEEDVFVSAPTIRHDQRWPNYVPRAVKLGLKAQISMRLYVDEAGTRGKLSLYSTSVEEISDDALIVADIFAAHATVIFGRVREAANLAEAVDSRQSIGVAIGLLMERYKMNEEHAKAFLWRASSTRNVKVRDVAAEIVRDATNKGPAPDA